jgi:hypothetical protein
LQADALLFALRGTTDEAEGVYNWGGGEKAEEGEEKDGGGWSGFSIRHGCVT